MKQTIESLPSANLFEGSGRLKWKKISDKYLPSDKLENTLDNLADKDTRVWFGLWEVICFGEKYRFVDQGQRPWKEAKDIIQTCFFYGKFSSEIVRVYFRERSYKRRFDSDSFTRYTLYRYTTHTKLTPFTKTIVKGTTDFDGIAEVVCRKK